jgi:hypothetical protein
MSDTAQTNLREPNQTDWDNYNSGGSNYMPPPPAQDAAGKPIVYQGQIASMKEQPNKFAVDAEGNSYLNFSFDPIKLVNSGQYNGYELRFTEASVKPFEKDGKPVKGNPSKLANLLRSAGLQVKPQTNADWRRAVEGAKARPISFTVDWSAYNKDTGEQIKGYLSFPEDPERPGMRKSILKKGDVITERDAKGNVTGVRKVESEVLFANARVRYFVDNSPKAAK